MYNILTKYSYNAATDLISQLSDPDEENQLLNDEQIHDATILQDWIFNKNPTQMSYNGIQNLHTNIEDDQFAVLFRNNHFSTIFKHGDYLYQLVTDIGFIDKDIVWERISNVDGDSEFYDHEFLFYQHTENDSFDAEPLTDEQLAQQLYFEEIQDAEEQLKLYTPTYKEDEQLAMLLQQEESRKYEEEYEKQVQKSNRKRKVSNTSRKHTHKKDSSPTRQHHRKRASTRNVKEESSSDDCNIL
eukprot:TRINITY_DN9218_c0_g1_i2.p1 TRINITY_DN9218_c0_g1~~TRINITY_DN9218_c0_g1_i2.p1  ORF type:complete len:243 (-),score=66.39 TRINITY_DN9218_c0_g1_i2:35-763(-)